MSWSRRDFVRTGSAFAAAGLFGIDSTLLTDPYEAARRYRPFRPLLQDPDVRAVAMAALDAARAAGARYADVRVASGVSRRTLAQDRQVVMQQISGSLNFGVRVLVDGAWGFASSTIVTEEEAARVAQVAVRQSSLNPWGEKRTLELAPAPVVADGQWETPIDLDPWNYTIQDQLELQIAANEAIMNAGEAMGVPGVSGFSDFLFGKTDVVFASTEGSYIAQRFHGFGNQYGAQVISEDLTRFGTSIPESFRTGGYGWEAIDGIPFAADAQQAVEDAVMMMNAREPDVGRYDVVLDSSAVSSAFNASIVAALEYDRVLGYEMHSGGTSYLSPPEEVLGQFSFNNPKLNVRATGSVPRAGGMYKWDVEGVAPADFPLIREGVVMDYFTTREFAPQLEWWYRRNGMPLGSRGTAGSQGSVLIQVVAPSIAIMDPGEEDVSIDEMIAETEDGIYIHRGGFGYVDPPMLNLQFSASGMAHEIRDGKLGDPISRPNFLARTPDFWRSMDMIGGAGTFGYHGGGTSKGDPFQQIARTVGAPAARFRQVNVFTYGRR
jgi:TldD protein